MNKIVKILSVLILGSMVLAACTEGTHSQLNLTAKAAKNANRGFPTAIRIYALSSDHLFYGYDFFSIKLDGDQVLDVTLKGVLDEISVSPGQTIMVGPYDIPKNTNFIGVVADFRNIERAKWRDTIKVEDRMSIENIYITVIGDRVNLITESDYRKALTEAKRKAFEAEEEKRQAKEKAKREAEQKKKNEKG